MLAREIGQQGPRYTARVEGGHRLHDCCDLLDVVDYIWPFFLKGTWRRTRRTLSRWLDIRANRKQTGFHVTPHENSRTRKSRTTIQGQASAIRLLMKTFDNTKDRLFVPNLRGKNILKLGSTCESKAREFLVTQTDRHKNHKLPMSENFQFLELCFEACLA